VLSSKREHPNYRISLARFEDYYNEKCHKEIKKYNGGCGLDS